MQLRLPQRWLGRACYHWTPRGREYPIVYWQEPMPNKERARHDAARRAGGWGKQALPARGIKTHTDAQSMKRRLTSSREGPAGSARSSAFFDLIRLSRRV